MRGASCHLLRKFRTENLHGASARPSTRARTPKPTLTPQNDVLLLRCNGRLRLLPRLSALPAWNCFRTGCAGSPWLALPACLRGVVL